MGLFHRCLFIRPPVATL